MEDGEVKYYMGGVGTVAIYRNNTDNKVKYDPPIFIRDQAITKNIPCKTFINLECVIKYNKHVICDFNMKNNFIYFFFFWR